MTDISRSTDILTEHLGYAPIGLIDDIVNAVNSLMYKCTSAMETYLQKKFDKGSANAIKYKIPDDEIQLGTAKLETLLESVIDQSFDKFELYVLRNLLVIPTEFIEGGWVRLKHHEGIDFSEDGHYEHGQDIDDEIAYMEEQLLQHKAQNEVLKSQITASTRDLQLIQKYNEQLKFLATNNANEEDQDMGAASVHLHELMAFLVDEVSRIVNKINGIQKSLSQTSLQPQAVLESRDQFIRDFASKAVEHAGLAKTDPQSANDSRSSQNDQIQRILSSIDVER